MFLFSWYINKYKNTNIQNNLLAILSSNWMPTNIWFITFGWVRAFSRSFELSKPLGWGSIFVSNKSANKPLRLSRATIAIASSVTFLVSGFSGENAIVPSLFAVVRFPLKYKFFSSRCSIFVYIFCHIFLSRII